jgi:beta-phosphoglucomutase-like phosphatase (HAD superfamily)
MGADPADCLVVEDSIAGVTAARRAGMQALGFLGGGHVYDGLGARLLSAGAGALADDIAAVSAALGIKPSR